MLRGSGQQDLAEGLCGSKKNKKQKKAPEWAQRKTAAGSDSGLGLHPGCARAVFSGVGPAPCLPRPIPGRPARGPAPGAAPRAQRPGAPGSECWAP